MYCPAIWAIHYNDCDMVLGATKNFCLLSEWKKKIEQHKVLDRNCFQSFPFLTPFRNFGLLLA